MRPVFIGGTGRCGTTLLRRCLGKNTKAAALPGELRIVVDPGGLMDLYRDLTEAWGPYRSDYAVWRFGRLMQEVTSRGGKRYTGHRMDQWVGRDAYWEILEDFLEELVRHESRGTWTGSTPGRETIYEAGPLHPHEMAVCISEFLAALFGQRSRHAIAWLDDTPYTIRHMKKLWTIFPSMRMIHIVRHPYDVLASYNRIRTDSRRWTSGSTVENARRIQSLLNSGYIARQSLNEPPVKVFHFEHLVEQPELTLNQIHGFLDLPMQDQTMEPIDPEEAHIGRRNFDEQGLSEEEIEDVREILDPVCERFGYETP